jgi:hypothetical protein
MSTPWSIVAGLVLVSATAAAAQPSAAPNAVAVVAKVYQDFAAEAVIDSPDLSTLDLFSRSKASMARYLDDGLIALVLADRACSARSGDVCRLDFAPIWDAQDMVGAIVKISETRDPARVLVDVSYPDKTVKKLTYVMAQTAAGWRVHDIEYDSHESLVQMLKKPVK